MRKHAQKGAVLVKWEFGNQFDGVSAVDNLAEIVSHIGEAAPPVLFTVRNPEIIHINPAVSLLAQEDTQTNRELAESRIKTYMQMAAKPGALITAGALRTAVIDGVAVTDAAVKIGGSGRKSATRLYDLDTRRERNNFAVSVCGGNNMGVTAADAARRLAGARLDMMRITRLFFGQSRLPLFSGRFAPSLVSDCDFLGGYVESILRSAAFNRRFELVLLDEYVSRAKPYYEFEQAIRAKLLANQTALFRYEGE
jgi:hypothetical protein